MIDLDTLTTVVLVIDFNLVHNLRWQAHNCNVLYTLHRAFLGIHLVEDSSFRVEVLGFVEGQEVGNQGSGLMS